MIVITGAFGFIGGNLVDRIEEDVTLLDTKYDSLEDIYSWFSANGPLIDCVYHLGAITDTTEMDINKFDEYNLHPSIFIWKMCADYKIPLVYASSAATYGDGSLGFDDEYPIKPLQPLNPYGWSKQQFDIWVQEQETSPPFWCGLKFFNVYGYGEEHKGKMASMVYHMYNQINETGGVRLFKSHHPDYKDGEQLRDFIYVDDILDVCQWMYENQPEPGIYNVGTGKCRSFNDMAYATFKALGVEPNITYFDTPLNLREQYQYRTEAKMDKLRNVGYSAPFHSLESGVKKYCNLLTKNSHHE